MKCRLLFVVGGLTPGGLERQLHYLLQALDRERYCPAVAVLNFRASDVYVEPIRALGVPLHAVPAGGSRLARFRAFRQLVRQLKPEVVHSYGFTTNFVAHCGARGTSAVALGSVRSDFDAARREVGNTLFALNARWPATQVFNSRASAEIASRAKGTGRLWLPRRIVVVRNALDLARFGATPVGEGIAQIVGIGSLFSIKRWDRLIAAAAQLQRRGFDFQARIIGDGYCRPALQRQIAELELDDRFALAGFEPDVPQALANATFLAHTSSSEGCPNAVMEAMASARAVVSTDVGDVSDLVEDGISGFVVPNADARFPDQSRLAESALHEALVAHMAALLEDRALCRRMGEAGRAKAEREFALSRLVAQTLDAYRAAGWKD